MAITFNTLTINNIRKLGEIGLESSEKGIEQKKENLSLVVLLFRFFLLQFFYVIMIISFSNEYFGYVMAFMQINMYIKLAAAHLYI